MALAQLFRFGLWLLAAAPLLLLDPATAAAQAGTAAGGSGRGVDSTDRPIDLANYCRYFRTSPYCAPRLSGDDGAPLLYLVYFDPGSDAIRPGEEPMLLSALSAAGLEPGAGIAITGHADALGDEAAAMDLSLRRAASVANWLEWRGVETERLSISGAGFSRPMLPAPGGGRENLNRRVEILLDLE